MNKFLNIRLKKAIVVFVMMIMIISDTTVWVCHTRIFGYFSYFPIVEVQVTCYNLCLPHGAIWIIEC